MSFRDEAKAKVAQFLKKPKDQLQDDSVLTDLVQDSFVLVEMVIELQEELKLRLHQEDLIEVKTVGDLLSILEKKKS